MTLDRDALSKVMDAIDLETFFVCRNEAEAKQLMLALLSHMGFVRTDVVFVQHEGPGARVRGRGYVHPAGTTPPYFTEKEWET